MERNSERDVPVTITDAQWAAIQRRTIAANPRLADITDPETIRRSKAAGERYDRRDLS